MVCTCGVLLKSSFHPNLIIICFLCLGVGAGGEEQEAAALSIFHIPWLAFVVFILFVGTLSYVLVHQLPILFEVNMKTLLWSLGTNYAAL